MIKKITSSDITYREELQTIPIIAKFNEIIAVVNGLTGQIVNVEDHCEKLIKAAKKAAKTGNHADLHEYLKLRRER